MARARRRPRAKFRRILHATDFSRASEPAFRAALALAKQPGAELLLLHVVPPRGLVVGRDYRTAKTYEAIARHDAEAGLAEGVVAAKRAGVRARSLLRAGVPHTEIVGVAARERADLIVIGTHGRTGVSRFFIGSVAARVVQLSTCPVLTVRSE